MPKRKSIEDEDEEGGSQSQAALPLKAETADDLAARLCRFGARLSRMNSAPFPLRTPLSSTSPSLTPALD